MSEGTTLLPAHPEWEHQAHQAHQPFGIIEQQKVKTLGGEKLGQVAGLAIDPMGRLVIFHRAGRIWDQKYEIKWQIKSFCSAPSMQTMR